MFFNSMDLFSGLGGNAFAFKSFAKPLLYCEISKDAQQVLRAVMARGDVPVAPVHDDVRTLANTELYKAAKAREDAPLLVSASWPCQGNSLLGKRKGMEDPRSGLIRDVCDLLLDCKPSVFFLENTPAVTTNGSVDYLEGRLGEAFDVKWGIHSAEEVGFPHLRRRFFCVGKLKGFDFAQFPFAFEPMTRLHFRKDSEPPRCIARSTSVNPRTSQPFLHPTPRTHPEYFRRLDCLGNAVVPACSLYAFLTLAGLPVVDKQPKGKFTYTMDPSLYKPPPERYTHPALNLDNVVRKPFVRTSMPTPAVMWYSVNTLSKRSANNIGTFVLFERGTPDHMRKCPLNVGWVEWLMGFPEGYTAL